MIKLVRKNVIAIGAVVIALLLISSATAVTQVHSRSVIKTINKIEQIKNKIYSYISSAVAKFNKLLKDEKFGKQVLMIRSILKEKLSKVIDIDTLKNKINELLSKDNPEPQFIGAFGVVLLAIVYIIGWIITFGFYFLTTPGADWLERIGISLVAATIWPIVLLMWILT
ncbi:MAG: hypothetical protein DRN16_01300 [Thermoplasmata archaeon]|nr:MAG: hypothetical protein DRN16_01300 [Thermoplasmata archaeon]